MRTFSPLVMLILLFLSTAWSQDARRADELEPIGKIVTTTGTVSVEHKSAVIVQAGLSVAAKAGDFLYRGDVVLTGRDGAIGLAFTDGTVCNLSANARIELNNFIYEPRGRSNLTLFNLTKGASTFIAGQVAKTGDMKITTPVGTMGIRGTSPRVEIGEDGTVTFATLIEEGLAAGPVRTQERRATQTRQRQTRSALPADISSDAQERLNSTKNVKTKLCRNC